MCRLLAYWGPPVSVSDLLVAPDHSLLVQCSASRLQTSGAVNPDGWGIAWYDQASDNSDAQTPHRYRSAMSMPDDTDGLSQLATVEAGRFVAHVRHKSPGSPTEVAGNAPFVRGPLAFAHNGFVAGYRQGRREQLRADLSPAMAASIRSDADSEVLFGLVLDRLSAGQDMAGAVTSLVLELTQAEAEGHAPRPDRPGPGDLPQGKYNLVLTDGHQLVATRWGNTLFLRHDVPGPGAVIVASEPYDDESDWQEVPDHTLVRVADGAVSLVQFGPTPAEVHP
jgi:gamma-glutamyl hercynylcysteine S-oxide hydrolase